MDRLPLLCLLSLGLASAACSSKGADAPKPGRGRPDAGATAPVEIQPARRGAVRDGLEATGTVEARFSAIVRARVGGTLGAFELDEGSPVKVEQVLLRVERPELGTLLARARAQHEKARRDLQALERLLADGLVPTLEVEEARFAARQARLEVERLQDEAGLEVVRAPIDGLITARAVQPGEAVSPGAELFRVADLSALWVHLRLPERHLAKLLPGLPVEVSAEGLGPEGLTGALDRIAPVVDPTSGTAKLTVTLGDGNAPGGGQLRPGMYVRCRIIVDTRPDAVLVPRRALIHEDDRISVFVIEDGRARKRLIQPGYTDGDQIEAREGVAEGDAIVVFGQRGLEDGALVRAVAPPGQGPAVSEGLKLKPSEGGPPRRRRGRGADAGLDGGLVDAGAL